MALDYLTADTQEVKEALACIADMERALLAAERNYRPMICGERYMTGDEVCEFLHISLRTLQTMRDMRRIPFTSVGERLIIYPESGIHEFKTGKSFLAQISGSNSKRRRHFFCRRLFAVFNVQ